MGSSSSRAEGVVEGSPNIRPSAKISVYNAQNATVSEAKTKFEAELAEKRAAEARRREEERAARAAEQALEEQCFQEANRERRRLLREANKVKEVQKVEAKVEEVPSPAKPKKKWEPTLRDNGTQMESWIAFSYARVPPTPMATPPRRRRGGARERDDGAGKTTGPSLGVKAFAAFAACIKGTAAAQRAWASGRDPREAATAAAKTSFEEAVLKCLSLSPEEEEELDKVNPMKWAQKCIPLSDKGSGAGPEDGGGAGGGAALVGDGKADGEIAPLASAKSIFDGAIQKCLPSNSNDNGVDQEEGFRTPRRG
jgi:hypothetical protein